MATDRKKTDESPYTQLRGLAKPLNKQNLALEEMSRIQRGLSLTSGESRNDLVNCSQWGNENDCHDYQTGTGCDWIIGAGGGVGPDGFAQSDCVCNDPDLCCVTNVFAAENGYGPLCSGAAHPLVPSYPGSNVGNVYDNTENFSTCNDTPTLPAIVGWYCDSTLTDWWGSCDCSTTNSGWPSGTWYTNVECAGDDYCTWSSTCEDLCKDWRDCFNLCGGYNNQQNGGCGPYSIAGWDGRGCSDCASGCPDPAANNFKPYCQGNETPSQNYCITQGICNTCTYNYCGDPNEDSWGCLDPDNCAYNPSVNCHMDALCGVVDACSGDCLVTGYYNDPDDCGNCVNTNPNACSYITEAVSCYVPWGPNGTPIETMGCTQPLENAIPCDNPGPGWPSGYDVPYPADTVNNGTHKVWSHEAECRDVPPLTEWPGACIEDIEASNWCGYIGEPTTTCPNAHYDDAYWIGVNLAEHTVTDCGECGGKGACDCEYFYAFGFADRDTNWNAPPSSADVFMPFGGHQECIASCSLSCEDGEPEGFPYNVEIDDQWFGVPACDGQSNFSDACGNCIVNGPASMGGVAWYSPGQFESSLLQPWGECCQGPWACETHNFAECYIGIDGEDIPFDCPCGDTWQDCRGDSCDNSDVCCEYDAGSISPWLLIEEAGLPDHPYYNNEWVLAHRHDPLNWWTGYAWTPEHASAINERWPNLYGNDVVPNFMPCDHPLSQPYSNSCDCSDLSLTCDNCGVCGGDDSCIKCWHQDANNCCPGDLDGFSGYCSDCGTCYARTMHGNQKGAAFQGDVQCKSGGQECQNPPCDCDPYGDGTNCTAQDQAGLTQCLFEVPCANAACTYYDDRCATWPWSVGTCHSNEILAMLGQGCMTFDGLCDGEPCCGTPGDCNGDGVVNILDLVSLANCILNSADTGDIWVPGAPEFAEGFADPSDYESYCINQCIVGDVNNDGQFNILDIVGAVNIIMNGRYEQFWPERKWITVGEESNV